MLKSTAVISAVDHGSTSQPSKDNGMLLRGEVDPWETSSLNNSLLLLGLEKRSLQKLCFPTVFSYVFGKT